MKRVVRRLAWGAGVIWAVVSIAFAINVLLPGDAARMVAGPQARAADVARIRDQLGLDRPPIVRYALFWRRLVHVGPDHRDAGAHATCAVVAPFARSAVHVDFGKSFQMRQPVVDVVAERLPRTVALAVAGMLVQLLFGVASGLLAAVRRASWIDSAVVGTSLFGVSAPTFLIALVLQIVFARQLGILPVDGYGTTWAEHAKSLVLPALTLGIYGAAYYTRLVRDEASAVLGSDWVRTARAKGVPAWRVVLRHALRNALVPVVAAAGLDFGVLLGGAIVTETVFRWPGLGQLSLNATLDRDAPVLCACVIVTSVAVVASNLAADLLQSRLDPRMRVSGRGGGTR